MRESLNHIVPNRESRASSAKSMTTPGGNHHASYDWRIDSGISAMKH